MSSEEETAKDVNKEETEAKESDDSNNNSDVKEKPVDERTEEDKSGANEENVTEKNNKTEDDSLKEKEPEENDKMSKTKENGEKDENNNKSFDEKLRDQMMAEIDRVRKEMLYSSTLIKKPKLKPYSPDIYNSLSPYYNTYLIDYISLDQDPLYKPWGSYGQRETALRIVDPETSLTMDTFPLPPVESKLPGQLYKIKVWSKNLSGKENDLGSTRLPPVPPLPVRKLQNPEYQYFRMTYDEVPKFRQDLKKMYTAIEEKRKKSDYERVKKDWKRMNLDEMKELPGRSRFHYGKAISTYLGTSKGSLQAINVLSEDHVTDES